ncbi:MAG: hypothetical protein IPL08_02525 [Saprospiraceae bacterium]|nr:hypothetical protein [Saprospiraceae bacterium]MBK8670349.1 hypothetical protein [Saprospiraceae bacterium]MBL0098670.1 hypothetical protein [Saprospiraceae bacterium]
MHIKILVILLFTVSIIPGCYYDSEDNLYPSTACNSTNVSFANDIQPILANACNNCHNSSSTIGAGIVLVGHAAVLPYATSGSLVGSVKHTGSYSAMPKNASKLDDCKIAKLESWVLAGSPNN